MTSLCTNPDISLKPSYRRKPVSRTSTEDWTPASAGVTSEASRQRLADDGRRSFQEKEFKGQRRIVILGSTGSIGVNALGVVRELGDRCQVVGLSAHANTDRLLEQVHAFQPEVVAVWEETTAKALRSKQIVVRGKPLAVLSGLEGLVELAAWPTANFVLSAVVGGVGLRPLLAALRGGKTVALANKEALVMAGDLVMAEAKRWAATLLPVDSEHSAIFQCLQGEHRQGVQRLLLTASGGPFYRYNKPLSRVSVKQALAHPTWKMGRKITIDCATLMNKGLETLEASILFGLPLDRVQVVIHPQSIVHSLVEFVDGAMLAQLSWPDMCLSIQYALTYPQRYPGRLRSLDLPKVNRLDFSEPDFRRFPCLSLAREAGRKGGTWPTVLNAADEVAVHAFLKGQITFSAIAKVIEKTMDKHQGIRHPSLEAVLEADRWARQQAEEQLV